MSIIFYKVGALNWSPKKNGWLGSYTNQTYPFYLGKYIRSMQHENLKILGKILGYNLEEKYAFERYSTSTTVELQKNVGLAEMFGIILGDGHFSKNYNVLAISTDPVDYPRYDEYVKAKIIADLGVEPQRMIEKDSKSDQWRTSNPDLLCKVEKLGLHSGNKTINQIDVLDWIKQNQDLNSLRFQTDIDRSRFANVTGTVI